MYLQLAEGYEPPEQYMGDPAVLTRVRGYSRSGSRVPAHLRRLSEEGENPYVFVPDTTGETRGVMVREDYFDDLSEEEWIILMEQLSAYQDLGMSEFAFLEAKGRRRRRRAERRKLRADKKRAKNEIHRPMI